MNPPWTRGVFGLFVVVCLNLALQPCAMALGGEQPSGCPHCPPTESREHQGHHGMAGDEAVEASCATAADDCSLDGDLNYDGRNAQLKLNDAPVDSPLAISDFFAAATKLHHVESRQPCLSRSPPPGSPHPLNVLYCVYLD